MTPTKHHGEGHRHRQRRGQLLADVKYDGGTAIPEFTNTYRAQPATDTPTAVKAVSASEGNHYKLKGDDFTFTLHRVTAPDGVTAEADQTKTNDARGDIRFDQLSFPLPGTYVYTVSERDVTVPGVTKDGTVTTITYTVKDVGHAGRLKVVDKSRHPFGRQDRERHPIRQHVQSERRRLHAWRREDHHQRGYGDQPHPTGWRVHVHTRLA